jgi:GT2 family glycosyltransferase
MALAWNRMLDHTVAFVIVCWNSRDLLDTCLGSIDRQTAGKSLVIVVDNGSEDGSQAHIRASYPTVQLIEAGRNLLFAAACNVGIRAALADPACRYVAFLNDDAWLADDWLERLLSFAEHHVDGAGFQGLTLDARDHDVVDSFGLYIGHAGRAIQMGYRGRDLQPETGEVFGVNAAACLYSRAFLSAQPFGDEYLDADLRMYLEDVDLAARAVVMGWKNYFVKEAVAYHLGSGGGREDRTLALRLTCRNDVLVLVKNLPWSLVARTVPGMLRAELARYRGFLRTGDYRKVGTMMYGRLLGVLNLPRFLGKRSVLGPHRRITRDRLWNLMAGSPSGLSESGDRPQPG